MNRSRKLLIVDDEATFAGQLADILSDMDYEPTLLHAGDHAVELLSKPHSFDLMLLDVHMPRMTGVEVVRALKDQPLRPPIVLMTAFSSLQTAIECIRMGADDYITKPFDLDLLLLTLDRVFERHALRRQNDELNRLIESHSRDFRRSQDALRALTEVLRCLPPAQEFPQTVFDILKLVHQILESGHSAITMRGDARAITYHIPAGPATATRRPHVEQAMQWVADNGATIGVEGGTETVDRSQEGGVLKGGLIMPIHANGSTFGAVHVWRPDPNAPFTQPDIQLLEFVCAEISILHSNAILYESFERMTIGAITSLAKTITHKDRGTSDHLKRSRVYMNRLLDKLSLSKEERNMIGFAMQLHDIGKIRVPGRIINKPGPLDEDEWNIMRMHPVWGYEILNSDGLLRDVAPLVKHHHERYDGGGYPDGLTGTNIPMGSRFLSIVDAFDAMRSDRPYRKCMPLSLSLEEIRTNLGTQFDPDLGEMFLQTVGDSVTAA